MDAHTEVSTERSQKPTPPQSQPCLAPPHLVHPRPLVLLQSHFELVPLCCCSSSTSLSSTQACQKHQVVSGQVRNSLRSTAQHGTASTAQQDSVRMKTLLWPTKGPGTRELVTGALSCGRGRPVV